MNVKRLILYSLLIKRLLPVVAFCCTLFCAAAQNSKTDSLKSILKRRSIADTQRMAVLIDLGVRLYRDNAKEARRYYEECYTIALKSKDFYFMGESMKDIGAIYHYRQDYDSAGYFYQIADSLFNLDRSPGSKEARIMLKSDMADVEKNNNRYEKAITMLLEAIDMMKQSDNSSALGVMYSNVGGIYYDMKQYDKTLEYDLKALGAHQRAGTSDYSIANSELFVAGDYITLNKLPEARSHIEQAETIVRKANSSVLSSRVYGYWGTYYRAVKEYDKAVVNLKESVKYAQKSEDVYHVMDGYRTIGGIYAELKQFDKSLFFLEKALALIRQLKNTPLEVTTLKMIASDQAAMGKNKEAVRFYEAYIQLNDSLERQKTKIRINDIENRYQAKQKADSILVLQKNNQIQQLALHKKQNQNISIIIGASLLLLSALLSYRNLRNRHRLLKQSEELHEQQIDQLKKERRMVAMQSVIKGQEEERSRLAKDLHDGVGGLLSGVKLSLSTMKGNVFLSEGNAQSVNNVLAQLDRSITELRQVSHNMMPEALIKFGLKETLENYCENIDLSGKIKIQFQAYGMERRMEQNTEIVLYRIVQELLNNVLKHADAQHVLVQLTREENRFNLTVEDDGKGFDTENGEQHDGAGLANIRARVEYLNGTVDIRSAPGEGTSVNIVGEVG